MTRKQAILQAITILSTNGNAALCDKLQEICDELPINHWSKKAVFDAIDQYILDNNKFPSKKEIEQNPNLPKHSTIRNRFGLSMKEFRLQFYPDFLNKCNSRIYWASSAEDWELFFKQQYKELNYPTMAQYDKLRIKNTPSARHIAKICNCKTWNELLHKCGFPIIGQNQNSICRVPKQKIINKCNIINTDKKDTILNTEKLLADIANKYLDSK